MGSDSGTMGEMIPGSLFPILPVAVHGLPLQFAVCGAPVLPEST